MSEQAQALQEFRRTAGLCAGDLPRLCLSGDAFRLLLLAERGRFLRPGVGESEPCDEQNSREWEEEGLVKDRSWAYDTVMVGALHIRIPRVGFTAHFTAQEGSLPSPSNRQPEEEGQRTTRGVCCRVLARGRRFVAGALLCPRLNPTLPSRASLLNVVP